MARTPGATQKRQRPAVAEQRTGRRSRLREVEPLFSTYSARKPRGAKFDKAAADRAVCWIETELRHFKGKHAGEPFLLLAWQRRLMRELFGWKRADGTRLYRRAYVEAPRKSGKTTLAAAIGLLLAFGDEEAGPEVAFAAYDQEQAKIAYGAARRMVEANDELWDQTTVYASALEMQLRENPGGVLRCLSRDSAQKFGMDLHGAILDELFTWRDRRMWEALTSSQGAREQPLIFAISTAGWDQASVCFEQHELTRQIHEGDAADPEFLGVVYGAPVEADWQDPEVWRRANPSLGATVKPDYYRAQARRAANAPAEQNAFRTLLLSQWVGQATRYLDVVSWDACGAVPEGKEVAFGGLDLSATTDLTAFAVVSGGTDVYLWAFLPEQGIVERERRDRVPYRAWADEGTLTLTPGPVIDYGFVREAIFRAAEEFDLRHVEYDRWNASQLVQELEDEGIEMFAVGQGFASMSAPTKELQRLVVEGKLRHGGNPLLRWSVGNFAVAMDAAGNVKPDRAHAGGRIDPVAALIMAIDGWQRRGHLAKRVSVYEARFATEAALSA